MLAFRAAEGAGFSYALDFTWADYANISFLDAAGEEILLHLSLRRGAGLAALNTRRAGAWGTERRARIRLAPRGGRVEIRFARGRAELRLNGRRLRGLGGPLPDLDRIAQADFHGGVVAESVALTGPGGAVPATGAEIAFAEPFTLEGWACDPAALVQRMDLAAPELSAPLPAADYDRPELPAELAGPEGAGLLAPTPGIGFHALVPGRVWRGGARALSLQPRVNGRPAGAPLRLTREGAGEMIERAMAEPALRAQPRLALLALEHAHYGALFGTLSPAARGALQAAAELHGLAGFVPPPAPAPPPGPAPAEAQADAARAEVSRALRREGADPGAALARLGPLPRAALRRLCLDLAGVFCGLGAFDALLAFARARGFGDPAEGRQGMETGAAFPFLLAEGRATEIAEALPLLQGMPGDHVDAPALAWTLRGLIEAPAAPGAAQALAAYARRLEVWAAAPEGRTADAALSAAGAALCVRADRLGLEERDALRGAVLRAHGLDPGFWTALDAEAEADAARGGVFAPGPELAAARDAFAAIAAGIEAEGEARPDPVALDAALSVFERLGAAQTARLRLGLLGPTGAAPRPGERRLDALRRTWPDLRPVALRALAAPDWAAQDAEEAEALAGAAREAILEGYASAGFPRAPRPALLAAAAARVRALAAGEAGAADPAALERLAEDCRALSGAPDRHMGAALAALALNGLLRRGDAAGARLQLAHLGRVLEAVPGAERETLERGPALASALFALRKTARLHPGPLAEQACAALAPCAPHAAPPPPAGTEGDGDPVFDALVCVISCRAYLHDRIPALRAGWLADLPALGVPHLFVVGGAGAGGERLEGDVLHLDAPDDYEGLPDKILAAADWVRRRSGYGHMIKIDDDSALDAHAFLTAQGWRRIDYHGRWLSRRPGAMDRSWHMAKSGSERGRFELDKSPEPSVYADGGSAYALSRRALEALAMSRRTREGAGLRLTSFMEDKLVGDLLARAGFGVEEEDHRVAIWRRAPGSRIPAPSWENGFYASRAAPMVQMHLDAPEALEAARAVRDAPALRPPKLWPLSGPPRLRYNSNALELISSPAKLAEVNAAPLAVIGCLRDEAESLPAFLAHHRALGVGGFLMVDNRSEDGSLDLLAAEPDVAVFSADTDYAQARCGVDWQETLMAALRPGRWSLVLDADELLVPGDGMGPDLAAALEGPDFAGADAVRLLMIDMYPQGPLAETRPGADPFAAAGFVDRVPLLDAWPGRGRFSNAETWTSALRRRLFPDARADLFTAQKYALLRWKPWMRLAPGLHYAAGLRPARRDMVLAHFKYHAGFADKARREAARGQHFNGAEEYRRYLDLLSGGRETLFDPALSVPWRDSPMVAAILAGRFGEAGRGTP